MHLICNVFQQTCLYRMRKEIDRIIITRVAGKAEAVFGLLEHPHKIVAQKLKIVHGPHLCNLRQCQGGECDRSLKQLTFC